MYLLFNKHYAITRPFSLIGEWVWAIVFFFSQQADGEDELKKRQLMELAIINGTYRDSSAKAAAAAGTIFYKYFKADCTFFRVFFSVRWGMETCRSRSSWNATLIIPCHPRFGNAVTNTSYPVGSAFNPLATYVSANDSRFHPQRKRTRLAPLGERPARSPLHPLPWLHQLRSFGSDTAAHGIRNSGSLWWVVCSLIYYIVPYVWSTPLIKYRNCWLQTKLYYAPHWHESMPGTHYDLPRQFGVVYFSLWSRRVVKMCCRFFFNTRKLWYFSDAGYVNFCYSF